jgi:hypothetical protein
MQPEDQKGQQLSSKSDTEQQFSPTNNTKEQLSPKKNTEQHFSTKSHTEQQFTSKNHTEQQFSTNNHTEQQSGTKNHTEQPRKTKKKKTKQLFSSKNNTEQQFSSKDKTEQQLITMDNTQQQFSTTDNTQQPFSSKSHTKQQFSTKDNTEQQFSTKSHTEQQLSTKSQTVPGLQGCQDLQASAHPRPPFMLQPVDWQLQGPGYFNLWRHHPESDSYVPHCFYHATCGWCLPTFFVNPARLDCWKLADVQFGPAIIVTSEYHPTYGYAARVKVCTTDGRPMRHVVPAPQPVPRPLHAPQGAWVRPLRPALLQQSEQQHWQQPRQPNLGSHTASRARQQQRQQSGRQQLHLHRGCRTTGRAQAPLRALQRIRAAQGIYHGVVLAAAAQQRPQHTCLWWLASQQLQQSRQQQLGEALLAAFITLRTERCACSSRFGCVLWLCLEVSRLSEQS